MDHIGAYEARTHLPKLLDRVAHGESLTITRHGQPIARLVPVESDRERAQRAIQRMERHRRHIKKVPLEELLATTHEGHRY